MGQTLQPERDPSASPGPIDFAYLDEQTLGDVALTRELLDLFVGQARRLHSTLADLPGPKQAETIHLLKGSARGIGAWQVDAAAAAYEAAAGTDARRVALASFLEALQAAVSAATAHRSRQP